MMRFYLAAAVVCASLAALAAPALAQSPRASATLCDGAKQSLPAWDDCLRKGEGDTDRAVQEALARIKTAIDARADLTGQQRTLLKRMMGESNDLWIRYRNHLCQNVMPLLAGAKARIYEENLSCIIDMNTARTAELASVTAAR